MPAEQADGARCTHLRARLAPSGWMRWTSSIVPRDSGRTLLGSHTPVWGAFKGRWHDSGWSLSRLWCWFCCYTTSTTDVTALRARVAAGFRYLAHAVEFAVLYFNTHTFYPMNKASPLIMWLAKACTQSWSHPSCLQRNAGDRLLLTFASAEGVAVESTSWEMQRYSWEIRLISRYIHISIYLYSSF